MMSARSSMFRRTGACSMPTRDLRTMPRRLPAHGMHAAAPRKGARTGREETRSQLEAALFAANHDPNELDRLEERLFALRAAGRKYNVAVDNLAALSAKHAADLATLEAGAEELKRLEAAAREADAPYNPAAAALFAARQKTPPETPKGLPRGAE